MGAFRKGYATEGLKAGVDVNTMVHLMGHTNGVMLAKVYARVQADPAFMALACSLQTGPADMRVILPRKGRRISVCHFPPGTSKWNKIEHRVFCHITENWRGRPLVSREVAVDLIGHTTTETGLSIRVGRRQSPDWP